MTLDLSINNWDLDTEAEKAPPLDYFNGGEHGERYGDRDWIAAQIDLLAIRDQKPVRERYSEIYIKLSGDRDQRFRVNKWLRLTVAKRRYIDLNPSLPF